MGNDETEEAESELAQELCQGSFERRCPRFAPVLLGANLGIGLLLLWQDQPFQRHIHKAENNCSPERRLE